MRRSRARSARRGSRLRRVRGAGSSCPSRRRSPGCARASAASQRGDARGVFPGQGLRIGHGLLASSDSTSKCGGRRSRVTVPAAGDCPARPCRRSWRSSFSREAEVDVAVGLHHRLVLVPRQAATAAGDRRGAARARLRPPPARACRHRCSACISTHQVEAAASAKGSACMSPSRTSTLRKRRRRSLAAATTRGLASMQT